MDKHLLSEFLENIATLLELKGENPFKIRAYHNAARSIENLSEDIEEIIAEKRLQEIAGIGEGIAEKITELIQTGHSHYLEELQKHFPPHLSEMLQIQGLGPKKVKILYDKLGISSIGELEYACKENRLLDLEGFGEKTQKNILQGIEYAKKNKGSYLFDQAYESAEKLLLFLKKQSSLSQIAIAGSLRRHKEIVHDIDLIASVKGNAQSVIHAFTSHPEVETLLAKGETKTSLRLKNGIQVDLRIVDEKAYPAALLYFTGSKEHNTALRGLAKDKGLKLNEYGLFRNEKQISCASEEEIYKALGLYFIPPELRENMGEIEWVAKKKIPLLIEESDLQGIFHVHSTWSDGNSSIEIMAKEAAKLGFKYVGMSDHSQSAKYAGGLSPSDIEKQHAEIDTLNKKLKIKILKGIESDILADGSLDYSEKILKKFDFVIASVHSGFKMKEEEMTKRLIRALENPYTTMLGHMTGRLLLAREGYALNVDKIIEAAAKHKKIIEINSNPHRFDIDWRYLKKAAEKGVRFSINPDAHSPEGLKDTFLGIGLARKGWLQKKDILNSQPLSEVKNYLLRNS